MHSELVRFLHSRGIVSDVLDWSKGYTIQDLSMMNRYYDCIYSVVGETWPLTDTYGIPHNKIVAVAHGEYDLHHAINSRPADEIGKFADYAVISEFLRDLSIELGIERIPKVVRYGINYGRFFRTISPELKIVGYGGSMHRPDHLGIDWKRGVLAEEAAKAANLTFKPAGNFHYLAMPHYYGQVDAVLVTSSREGFGLPAMEAAAAGRLVISTPVGGFPRQASMGAGLLAPVEPDAFKEFCIERLTHFSRHPDDYVRACGRIQQAARVLDWSYVVDDWISLFARAAEAR
ncbi:MAG: glycosyltransferase [Reyranellaceae bacterium]